MKAILFDFGGTIDTDGVHWSEKFCDLYARFRPDVGRRDVERSFVESEQMLLADPELPRLTFEETLARQLRLQFGILRLPLSQGLLDDMSRACYADVVTTTGKARAVLARLHSRYRLGVVSNFYGNLEIVCREFGMETLFSVFIDSAVVGVRKPDPRIFSLALDSLKVAAAETFVVGDSYDRDIVPGKQLGCSTIWLKGKSWNAPTFTGAADRTIGRFDEIQEIFLH